MAEIFTTRPYSDNPYLIMPNNRPLKIKAGTTIPTLRAFVYQRTNLFGDPCPLELGGLLIRCNIYNSKGALISAGKAYISNMDESEIEYTWQKFDLQEPGLYYAEFIFKDIMDNTSFVLPSNMRIEIVAF